MVNDRRRVENTGNAHANVRRTRIARARHEQAICIVTKTSGAPKATRIEQTLKKRAIDQRTSILLGLCENNGLPNRCKVACVQRAGH